MNDVRWCHSVRQRKGITLNDFSMSWGWLDDSLELRVLSAKPWDSCCIDNILVANFTSMVLGVIVLALVIVIRCLTIYITISCCAYGGRWSSESLTATPCHASADLVGEWSTGFFAIKRSLGTLSVRVSLGYKLLLAISITNVSQLFNLLDHYGIHHIFKQSSCNTIEIKFVILGVCELRLV